MRTSTQRKETITLEYNPKSVSARKLLAGILSTGIFEKVEIADEPEYNPEFVQMIRERDKEPKFTLTEDEQKKLLFG